MTPPSVVEPVEPVETRDDRWLVALDIDGTVLTGDGVLVDETRDAIRRVAAEGNEVMLATGRSASTTLPVLERLGLSPEYVVCANGAVTMRRDPDAPMGYSRIWVETFDPSDVLRTIHGHLSEARFAVENAEGLFRYAGGHFPDGSLGAASERVEFDDLLQIEATRVVVLSPEHDVEDFLQIVERMGLHQVSYNVGWTAWLDVAPDGVNKATALERVRAELRIPRHRVFAAGDGRNDIDMLEWAGEFGRGVAMGQAPAEVIAVASEVTGEDVDCGLADALATL